VPGLLADNDVEGHLHRLLSLIQSEGWHDLWIDLEVTIHTFESLDLPRNATDAVLWHECQPRQLLILTANRNAKGQDSLELTLRDHNSPDCLPVLTLTNDQRVMRDRDYALRVVERMLNCLIDLENLRGTGRQFLP